MSRSLRTRIRNFGRLWQEEGARQSLHIVNAKLRLALLRRQKGSQSLHRRHVEALGLPMYLDLADDGLSKTLFYRGVHEPVATQWLKDELAPGMTVLDIGANIGYYVLLAATQIGPQGKIYAAEPVPTTFAILRQNLELNQLNNVVAECVAISSTNGEAAMQVMEKRNWAHLSHGNLQSARAQTMHQGVTEWISVPTKTLDYFVQEHHVENVNFLRMDVEGYETEVIKGGRHTLARHRPMKVFMEVHPFFASDLAPFVEMISFLYEDGLRVKYVGHHMDVIMSWPDKETVIDYLTQNTFREAPHLLLEAQ